MHGLELWNGRESVDVSLLDVGKIECLNSPMDALSIMGNSVRWMIEKRKNRLRATVLFFLLRYEDSRDVLFLRDFSRFLISGLFLFLISPFPDLFFHNFSFPNFLT